MFEKDGIKVSVGRHNFAGAPRAAFDHASLLTEKKFTDKSNIIVMSFANKLAHHASNTPQTKRFSTFPN